jgi:hypothetical protein
MEQRISIERESWKIHIDGDAKFFLNEINLITQLPDGRQNVQYGDSRTFGLAEWKKLLEANGDFRVLGIEIKTNEPIKGFSDYSKY